MVMPAQILREPEIENIYGWKKLNFIGDDFPVAMAAD